MQRSIEQIIRNGIEHDVREKVREEQRQEREFLEKRDAEWNRERREELGIEFECGDQ